MWLIPSNYIQNFQHNFIVELYLYQYPYQGQFNLQNPLIMAKNLGRIHSTTKNKGKTTKKHMKTKDKQKHSKQVEKESKKVKKEGHKTRKDKKKKVKKLNFKEMKNINSIWLRKSF